MKYVLIGAVCVSLIVSALVFAALIAASRADEQNDS